MRSERWDQACGNCYYYESIRATEIGHCQRYAPRPYFDKISYGDESIKEPRKGYEAQWPLVSPTEHWCGEFKLNPDESLHDD